MSPLLTARVNVFYRCCVDYYFFIFYTYMICDIYLNKMTRFFFNLLLEINYQAINVKHIIKELRISRTVRFNLKHISHVFELFRSLVCWSQKMK